MTPEITAPSRRTITKGAAWAAPAVAVAATAPSLAASPIDCDGMGGTFNEVTPGTYTVTIPDCITRIQYAVRGGGGAGPVSGARGAGAEIEGSLALVPGTSRTLTLIVADGGGISSTGLAAGGSGYGRGGRGSNAANSGPNGRSFGGGGGSAIRVGTTPVLIAGGGGGGVQAKFINNVTETISLTSTHAATGFPFGDRTAGGTSGNALGMGVMAAGAGGVAVLSSPARAGSYRTGGGGGGKTQWLTSVNNRWTYVNKSEGADGGNFGTGLNGGGNGGGGAAPLSFVGENSIPSAGGGGGGYGGGGGGGLTYARFDDYTVTNAAATSGGAGSSFVSTTTTSGVSVLTSDIGEGTSTPRDTGAGHTGWIFLRWS